jgi:RNA polymerase sigma factor (sigma-70 family)
MGTARAALGGGRSVSRDARVEALLRDHRGTLLWIARRWTGSADEAEDALQRAMEIYVRRLDSIDPATELAWVKVVVRNEALALRRARSHGVPLDADDVAERIAAPDVAVQERIEREERNARSVEALAQLKPDERTALLLKAEGYSYREIGERQGWTYTKVNRAITEGRRRFLSVFASIEAGEECERFAPTLLALVEGGAESADVVALRPHLRHCATCRATVRELHASRRHRLALHLPFLAGVAPVRWLGHRVVGGSEERDTAVGSGADVRGFVHGVVNRVTGPDAVAGVQLASSGGGRGPAVAALLGLCLSGGAGTYCIATGGLPDPVRLVDRGADTRHVRKADAAQKTRRDPEPAEPAASQTAPAHRPVAVATTTPQPTPTKTEPKARSKPKRSPDARDEFGFEGVTGSAEPPPASGGGGTTATASSAGSSPSPPTGGSIPSSSSPPTSGGEFMP